MTAAIRVATAADVPALAALRRTWVAERHRADGDPGFEERFARWFEEESARRVFWLAILGDEGDEEAGMVNLTRFERMPTPRRSVGGWGELSNLYVRVEHRGRGIGGALVAALAEHADDLGLERIVLNPTEASIPLYRRHGFRPAADLLVRTGPSGG